MPYHFNSTGLAPGSIILPGNWGRIIKKCGSLHNLYERETLWERLRASSFPHLPSRLEASFFFLTEMEAKFYGRIDRLRYLTMIMYEVELLEPLAPQHTADWELVSKNGEYYNIKEIYSYWNGELNFSGPLGERRAETLAVTPLKILRSVEF